MNGNQPEVVVVGGGLAGLVAARGLLARGARVRLLEARAQVGGRCWTDELLGCRVDAGVQLLGSMYTRSLRLVEEIGLGARLERSPGRDALWRGGRAHEVVYGSVPSMLASGGLPLRTKMRLGTSYVPFLTRYAGALSQYEPERAARAGLDAESIGAWGEREVGREFVEYLVYPQLAAYYGSLPEETSAGFYHTLARHGMDVSVYALRGGMGELCQALAADLASRGAEVRCSTRVERVELAGGAVTLRVEGTEERADGVVIATPAPTARELLGHAPSPLTDELAQVRFRPALTLALALDRPVGVRFFGVSFPRETSSRLAAVCVEENKGGGLVPEGRGLLLAIAAPEVARRMIGAEAREILDELLPDVRRAFPELEARVERARVYRWPEGHPVFYPGYLGRLGQLRGGRLEGEAPLALAGDYLLAPTVEGAVVTGEEAAERLWRRLVGGDAGSGV